MDNQSKFFMLIDKESRRVIRGVIAFTKEEVEENNPYCYAVEVTMENSPWVMGSKYEGEI